MYVSNGALVVKTPLSLSGPSPWFPYMPTMSAGSTYRAAYAEIFTSQLWVFVVVTKLAKATARLPLPVYERDERNGRNKVDHPLALLLEKPNSSMSGYHLKLWTSATTDIFGEAFWLKRRRAGAVEGLYPLHPSGMTEAEGGGWNFDNGRIRMTDIPASDIVHFTSYHPTSLTRGMTALEPLRATLENEWHARSATSNFWSKGARPALALLHKANLSPDALSRLRGQMDSLHGGSVNTGSTLILEEGMEPRPMSLTAEEAQYIETRKLNREEVCAAYDVPPPVVHILDRATFSNITEQMRSMYRDTMGARLPSYEAAIETDLRAVEWPSDDVYAEFLLDEVLRGDFEARQAALAQANHLTIAEKRRMENLPFIEGTDRIFLNTATMPLDAIDAQAQALTAREVSSDILNAITARAVLGRLNWQTSIDEVSADALVVGIDSGSEHIVREAVARARADGSPVAALRTHIKSLTRGDAP